MSIEDFKIRILKNNTYLINTNTTNFETKKGFLGDTNVLFEQIMANITKMTNLSNIIT